MSRLFAETDNNKMSFDFKIKGRKQILFKIISKLCGHNDKRDEEKIESYSHRKDNVKVIDFYHNAINSIRGTAFELLFYYVFKTNGKKRIDKNVRKIIGNSVFSKKEKLVVFSIIGRYIPNLYFRDREWGVKIMKKLFNKRKKKYFVVSIIGQTLGSVYTKFFNKMGKEYLYIVENFDKLEKVFIDKETDKQYQVKFFNDEDYNGGPTFITHIAIAFLYNIINKDDKLIRVIFDTENKIMVEKFLSIISGHIQGENFEVKIFTKDKLVELWEMVKNKKNTGEFINIFSNKKTIEIFGLEDGIKLSIEAIKKNKVNARDINIIFEYLKEIVKENKKEVLEILNLLVKSFEDERFYQKNQLKDLLEIIYDNIENKVAIEKFIERLLKSKKSHYFWELKEILK